MKRYYKIASAIAALVVLLPVAAFLEGRFVTYM
jgi:hypothetical protein